MLDVEKSIEPGRCRDCRWFRLQATAPNRGHCYVAPPAVKEGQFGMPARPQVFVFDGCAQFSARVLPQTGYWYIPLGARGSAAPAPAAAEDSE